jgi:hypothetical protein
LKLVKPLLHVVGKWAPKLAPIAAMIPGVGPIVSGYLVAAGTAAKLAEAHGVEFVEMAVTNKKTGKKEKQTKISGKPKNILAYKKALEKAAKKAKKLPKDKLKKGAAAMKAYKGKKLPREDLTKKKVLKRGSAQWTGAMQALGLRAGQFRTLTPAQQQAAVTAARAAILQSAGATPGAAQLRRAAARSRLLSPQRGFRARSDGGALARQSASSRSTRSLPRKSRRCPKSSG